MLKDFITTTPHVVSSLQTSTPDFNFNDISEGVKNAPRKSDRTEVTKELLEKLLTLPKDATIEEKEQALSDLDYLTLHDYVPNASKKELNEHVDHLIRLLNKDYGDKPGTLHVIANLTRVATKKDADRMFEDFVNECDESDKFHDGVMELQEEVKNNGIIHNSLLEEAHFLFTKEEPKNPYEKEFQKISEHIEAEKEKVWKSLKVGKYYDNRVVITKKTKKYVTISYGKKEGRFCKDDMTIFNKSGVCDYFNLWDEYTLDYHNDCLSTMFCTDKQDILSYLESFDENIKDAYITDIWRSRPWYVKQSFVHTPGNDANTPVEFHKSYGYDTLKNCSETTEELTREVFDLDAAKMTERALKNEALKNIIYSTPWESEIGESFNSISNDIPVVDTTTLTDEDIDKIKSVYEEAHGPVKNEKNFWIREEGLAKAVMQVVSEKRS